MLDGLPPRLADHLPQPLGPSERRSVSACYWRSNGQWAMGNPEPAPAADEWEAPQGVRGLIAPVLDQTGDAVHGRVLRTAGTGQASDEPLLGDRPGQAADRHALRALRCSGSGPAARPARDIGI